jgi:hypothetical protein|nr:MAG TPA: hypothetical protein [Caudoviricetes sp.]
MLEKFLKKQKRSSEGPGEKPLDHYRTYVYHHIRTVLEDGKLYDTSASKKAFVDYTSLQEVTFNVSKRRAYFLSPHGRWFSADEETEIKDEAIEDVGEFRMQIVKIIITYNDLRTEREDNVRAIMGKNGYELYREYFGEVEEA